MAISLSSNPVQQGVAHARLSVSCVVKVTIAWEHLFSQVKRSDSQMAILMIKGVLKVDANPVSWAPHLKSSKTYSERFFRNMLRE